MTTPYDKLRAIIKDTGSMRRAARRLNVSAAYISLIINDKAPMTREMADRLGFDLIETSKWVERA